MLEKTFKVKDQFDDIIHVFSPEYVETTTWINHPEDGWYLFSLTEYQRFKTKATRPGSEWVFEITKESQLLLPMNVRIGDCFLGKLVYNRVRSHPKVPRFELLTVVNIGRNK